MAVVTAPPKQTLYNKPALLSVGRTVRLLPEHTKPYRKRHLLLLILSISILVFATIETAVVVTRKSLNPRALFSEGATSVNEATKTTVKSSNGFSFSFDTKQFNATVHSQSLNGPVSNAELGQNSPLTSVTLTPLPSYVPANEAAAELEVKIEDDSAAFATFKSKIRTKTDISAITADYFAPNSTNTATISEESRTTEPIGGSLMTKTVYIVEPKFAGNPTRTIIWTAQVNQKPAALIVRGIIDGSKVPSSMAPIVNGMQFSTNIKVNGLSTTSKKSESTVEQKYAADLVSPAVVKIYHIVCGSLVYDGKVVSADTCNGASGSGFLVSKDGYVATNGHVVVYGAKDMLVNALLNDRQLLEQFLLGTRMSQRQVTEVLNRADLTASVISKIYDLPDSMLRLANQRSITVVATGYAPLEITDEAALKQMIAKFDSTENLKQASIIGYNYDAKDQLTVISDPKTGFTASDVALLKINVQNAPFIKLNSGPVTQNQKIMLFGFPTDADNQLTDNSKLGVTVTNGYISAIRDAAGGKGKLYQSDADASHGNSGGPAVDEFGQAIGLLTYRYSSGEEENAAKSYIRDIADFKDLVSAQNIALQTDSQTQTAWQEGLGLYGQAHYKEALKKFKLVKNLYPSHRLAGTYIDLSEQAIANGKNVKEPSLALLIIGIGMSLGGLLTAIVMIARHHGLHKIYRIYHQHRPAVHSA